MNWYTLLELAGYIALTELAYLPLTWWLWRHRETKECDMTFRLTAHKDFAAHGAETQIVNCTSQCDGDCGKTWTPRWALRMAVSIGHGTRRLLSSAYASATTFGMWLSTTSGSWATSFMRLRKHASRS
jgi:hypothetical protein